MSQDTPIDLVDIGGGNSGEGSNDSGFFRSVLESAPVDTVVFDDDGTIGFASETITDALGYQPDELVGEPFEKILVDEAILDDVRVGDRSDRQGVFARHATGGEVRVRVEFRTFEFEGRRLHAAHVHDSIGPEPYEQTIDRYDAITRISGFGVYQLDRDGVFEMVDETIVETLGYSRDELLGEHASMAVDEDDIPEFSDAIEGLLDDDEDFATVEFIAQTADEETIPCEAQVTLLRSGGSVRGTVGIVRDISDRKERAEELRQERGLIEHVLETSPVGIGVITPDGDISRVNDRAEELLGLTMEELSNQTFDVSQRKLYDSEGRQVSPEDLLSRVFDDREQVIDTEFTLERPDGDQVWASISIAPMMDAAGDVEKAAIIATDITDRKEREETLREERDVIEHVLETSPVGIGVITPDGDISRVNDRAEALFGLTDYELSTQTLDVSQRQLYNSEGHRIPPEDLLSRVFDEHERVLDSEFRLENPDGARIWLSISIAPIESTNGGGVEKAVIIGKDVTDRKRREETLREERDLIEQFLATSPVGIGVITPDGDISRVNDQAEELLGLTIEEITNQTLDVSQRRFYGASGQQVEPEDLLSRVFEDHERVLNSEFRLERPDGERVWTGLSIAPIESATGAVEKAVVIATDISDRKEREKRLRESEARLRQIAENINSAIWMADADLSEVLYINPAYEDITGRSRDSVYDNLMNHLDAVHPQDQRRVESAMKEVTQSTRNDVTAIRFQETYRVVRPDGSIQWVDSYAFPLHDDDGEVYRFVGVIDDITEVKEQQLELGRHRDELETLNQINTVIRRVNQGLVQAATREGIESEVCETLTDSKLYHAAWIGEVDTGVSDVTPKTGDGFGSDPLDQPFNFDAVEEISMAVESGDVQNVRDFDSLPTGLSVTESIDDGTFGNGQPSAAVIPLLYKETVYDVLVAYSSRANAFSVREQAVLLELGKTIGLAINAVARKDALLTDTVVELELSIADLDVFFVSAAANLGAEFEMEGITSQSDGSYLQYFSVTGIDPERVLELADDDPRIEHARVVTADEDGEDDGDALVEFVVTDESVANALAEYGGTIQSARFVDGGGSVVATFSQSIDVRNVVEAVQSTFSDIDLVSKQKRERSADSDREFRASLDELLTERQQTILETAYLAGYFEWPRDSSGEEVADSLDVAPATFHQHAREGMQTLVETFIEDALVV